MELGRVQRLCVGKMTDCFSKSEFSVVKVVIFATAAVSATDATAKPVR